MANHHTRHQAPWTWTSIWTWPIISAPVNPLGSWDRIIMDCSVRGHPVRFLWTGQMPRLLLQEWWIIIWAWIHRRRGRNHIANSVGAIASRNGPRNFNRLWVMADLAVTWVWIQRPRDVCHRISLQVNSRMPLGTNWFVCIIEIVWVRLVDRTCFWSIACFKLLGAVRAAMYSSHLEKRGGVSVIMDNQSILRHSARILVLMATHGIYAIVYCICILFGEVVHEACW